MEVGARDEPSYDLWTEPWIALETATGDVEHRGIEAALLESHEFRAVYDASPLAVAAIHRLLVAVLQQALRPARNADLEALWESAHFPADSIRAFGHQYGHRFDLFSESQPFLQTADLPRTPPKAAKVKSVAYLAFDIPAGTAVTHYRHGSEDEQAFCPACAAVGLVCIPAFATSGGQGIRPSVNGVPPIYVLPGGRTLFESLAASLLTPDYRPPMATKDKDEAWWVRAPLVSRGSVAREVGYLHSLTFPARRVRLHPERLETTCTQCGSSSGWLVRSMIFEMGEARPKSAEMWLDPFAAYRRPGARSAKSGPIPVRPVAGRAVWREFASLFLKLPAEGGTIRPKVLDQIAALSVANPPQHFRCIGVRTDMKAKVFEWLDAGFDVPPALLRDEMAAIKIEEALAYAGDCERILRRGFRSYAARAQRGVQGFAQKSQKLQGLQARMQEQYWSALAGGFRELTVSLAGGDRAAAVRSWGAFVVATAKATFEEVMDQLGDDADSLRRSETAKKWCAVELAQRRKDYLNE